MVRTELFRDLTEAVPGGAPMDDLPRLRAHTREQLVEIGARLLWSAGSQLVSDLFKVGEQAGRQFGMT